MSVGALRNLSSRLGAIADANDVLLPVWMIVLGIALLAASRRSASKMRAELRAARAAG